LSLGAFRGTGTLSFFPEGRTYSPPAERQAVVSFLRQARALSEGTFAFCGKRWTMRASSYRPRSRQGTEQNVPSSPAACANLPPAALPQIWVHPAPIFSFAKEKQK